MMFLRRLGVRADQMCSFSAVSVLFLVGLLQTWNGRNMMNPDGISYIEIGLAYVNRDWASAVNPYWSPLYSWVLGAILHIFKKAPFQEFILIHFVNFGIYVLALLCFRFFLGELIRYREELAGLGSFPPLPIWVWQLFGYSLFLSSNLDLLRTNMVTPDMAVSAFVYLSAGLLMRIRRGQTGWSLFTALGLVLGFGYLAKSVLFVFALVVIVVGFSLVRMRRIPAARLLLMIALFLLVAGPFITTISRHKRHLTIGESGWLTYMFAVNGFPAGYLHGCLSHAHFSLKHPPHEIHREPAVYEFGDAVGGSSPAWYDTSYWYDGAPILLVAKNQALAFLTNIFRYCRILFAHQASLVAGILVLFSLVGSVRNLVRGVAELWFLLAPATALLGLYFAIIVEGRYVSPFLLVTWAALFFGLRMPASPQARGVMQAVLLTAAGALVAPIGQQITEDAIRGLPYPQNSSSQTWALKDQSVAAELNKFGMREKDKVAFIGDSVPVYWAHLAKVRIVAEIPAEDVNRFYESDEEQRESSLKAFASTGAKVAVGDRSPVDKRWHQLGTTGYYVFELNR
jgi:hypothetical protein